MKFFVVGKARVLQPSTELANSGQVRCFWLCLHQNKGLFLKDGDIT